MNDFGKRYVVDTNILSQIGKRRRASKFFLEFSVLPEAVLHEASGFPDIDLLRNNVHPTTPRLLQLLIEVLATVPDTDTSLVDLYANLGNADPLVIASALEGREYDSQFLISPEWVVVSGDDAVRRKATEFNLEVLSKNEFTALIDEAVDGR